MNHMVASNPRTQSALIFFQNVILLIPFSIAELRHSFGGFKKKIGLKKLNLSNIYFSHSHDTWCTNNGFFHTAS